MKDNGKIKKNHPDFSLNFHFFFQNFLPYSKHLYINSDKYLLGGRKIPSD